MSGVLGWESDLARFGVSDDLILIDTIAGSSLHF